MTNYRYRYGYFFTEASCRRHQNVVKRPNGEMESQKSGDQNEKCGEDPGATGYPGTVNRLAFCTHTSTVTVGVPEPGHFDRIRSRFEGPSTAPAPA